MTTEAPPESQEPFEIEPDEEIPLKDDDDDDKTGREDDKEKMWNSMSVLEHTSKPNEFLPLKPATTSGRVSKTSSGRRTKNNVDPKRHRERGHSRPDDWVGKKRDKRGYKVKDSDSSTGGSMNNSISEEASIESGESLKGVMDPDNEVSDMWNSMSLLEKNPEDVQKFSDARRSLAAGQTIDEDNDNQNGANGIPGSIDLNGSMSSLNGGDLAGKNNNDNKPSQDLEGSISSLQQEKDNGKKAEENYEHHIKSKLSSSASSLDYRPKEFLPLRPSDLGDTGRTLDHGKHKQRAHQRPENWVGKKSTEKTWTGKRELEEHEVKEEPTEDELLLERLRAEAAQAEIDRLKRIKEKEEAEARAIEDEKKRKEEEKRAAEERRKEEEEREKNRPPDYKFFTKHQNYGVFNPKKVERKEVDISHVPTVSSDTGKKLSPLERLKLLQAQK